MNSALAESGNENYSETGHVFVSVEQAHSSRSFGQPIKTDPLEVLDLSQHAVVESEPGLDQSLTESTANTSLLSTKPLELCTSELQPVPLTNSVVTPPLSLLPSPPTLLPEPESVTAENSDDDKSDDDKSDEDNSDEGKSEKDINQKYVALQLKYNKQTEKLKQTQKNHDILKRKHAEMKDLFVYTVAEAKKAKMDPNSSTVSTIQIMILVLSIDLHRVYVQVKTLCHTP